MWARTGPEAVIHQDCGRHVDLGAETTRKYPGAPVTRLGRIEGSIGDASLFSCTRLPVLLPFVVRKAAKKAPREFWTRYQSDLHSHANIDSGTFLQEFLRLPRGPDEKLPKIHLRRRVEQGIRFHRRKNV